MKIPKNEENQPIVEKCLTCEKIVDNRCKIWYSPETRWRIGVCPNATHVKLEVSEKERVRIGQQKQKKKKK